MKLATKRTMNNSEMTNGFFQVNMNGHARKDRHHKLLEDWVLL